MRALVALLLALAIACSSAPAPTRCTPGASVACVCPGVGTGAQVCAADGASYSACVCGVDAGGDTSVTPGADATSGADVAVAVVDAPALDVVTAEDRPAAVDAVAVADAGPVDARADVDPRQTPACLAVTQECDRRIVNVQTGERDGGVTYHCGGCGITCAAGEFCVSCVCER